MTGYGVSQAAIWFDRVRRNGGSVRGCRVIEMPSRPCPPNESMGSREGYRVDSVNTERNGRVSPWKSGVRVMALADGS